MGEHAPKAVVQPQVLRWLRTTSGLSVEQTAKKLNTKLDNVIAWEAGEKQPSMPQVRNLAKAFKRPISYFYLPKPVKEPSIPHDFRRLPGAVPRQYSPALLYEIRLAFRRRLFAIYLAKEIGNRPVNFDEYGSVSLEQSPEDVALTIRTLLAVTLHEQKTLREPYTVYKFWRTKIEALGVFVFQATTVDLQQMLGFSLAYPELPVIVINRKLKPNGRTFSMLHEFVHLMVGESGVCDIDDGLPRNQREQRVEVFCNHVAGATLVSRSRSSRAFAPCPLLVMPGLVPAIHAHPSHPADGDARIPGTSPGMSGHDGGSGWAG